MPLVEGKHFAYNKGGFAAAKKARQMVRTSDGMMLGKNIAGRVTSKVVPKAGDVMSMTKKITDRVL